MCSVCARRVRPQPVPTPLLLSSAQPLQLSDRYVRYIRCIRYTSPAGDRERVGGTRGAEAQGVLKPGVTYVTYITYVTYAEAQGVLKPGEHYDQEGVRGGKRGWLPSRPEPMPEHSSPHSTILLPPLRLSRTTTCTALSYHHVPTALPSHRSSHRLACASRGRSSRSPICRRRSRAEKRIREEVDL